MKKIFLSGLILLLFATCKSQQYSMPSTVYQNWTLYNGYLTDGPAQKAEVQEKKLIQGYTLLGEYIIGQLINRTTLSDSAKTEFDALYGKTHAGLSLTLTATDYIIVDSISTDGVTYTSYFMSTDSVNALIAAGGGGGYDSTIMATVYMIRNMLEKEDSNLYATQTDIADILNKADSTLYATQTDIANMLEKSDSTLYATQTDISNMLEKDDSTLYATQTDISDMLNKADSTLYATQTDLAAIEAIGDSTWTSINVDSDITFGANGKLIRSNGPSNGIWYFSYDGITLNVTTNYVGYNTSGQILNEVASSSNPTLIPHGTYLNDGFTWVSDNFVGLVGNGISTLTSGYNVSLGKSITTIDDSLQLSGGANISRITVDSIHTSNGWHKNLISYGDVPSELSVRAISTGGVQSFLPVSGLGSDLTSSATGDILFSLSDTISFNDSIRWDDSLLYVGGNLRVNDTSVFNNEVTFNDTIRGGYMAPPSRYGMIYLDSLYGNSFKVDSISLAAKYGLKGWLPSLFNMLFKKEKGEIAWIYYLPDGTKIVTYSNNDGTPNERFAKTFTMHEFTLRHIFRNRILILSLIVLVISLGIYTIRKK